MDGVRTLVFNRDLVGLTSEHFTFSPVAPAIDFINAVGFGPNFSYHEERIPATINLVVANVKTCICEGGRAVINGLPFVNLCGQYPKSDLTDQQNPSCFAETFNGGLYCCRHGDILIDAEQEQPGEKDEVYMKVRYFFKEYTPQDLQPNLFRLWWMTEHSNGEYDIPRCLFGEECVHTITSTFTLNDLMTRCDEVTDAWCADSRSVTEEVIDWSSVYNMYICIHFKIAYFLYISLASFLP
jgi:hypothetical protein